MASSTQKMAHDYEVIAMAFHESAHCICALFNFILIHDVHVMSDKHQHGNTAYETHNLNEIESKILSKILLIYEIQTLYAGLVGEKIYYKEICGSDKFPMHLRIGCSNDIQSAAKLIHTYDLASPGKPRLLFKKQIQNDTKNILLNYWSDIRLISHMLYKFKELNLDDIKYFLSYKSNNKEFWKNRLKEIKNIYSKDDINEKELKDILLQNSVIIM